MNQNAVPTKCRALYHAFTAMQQQGTLKSLSDAEKMLKNFGANVETKNTIEFDFVLGGRVYEERLYEYNVPLHDGSHTTFYVDKDLGFECGFALPESYKKVIHGLHNSGQTKLH